MKKIEILFPEVCNLYGDLQNIEYLKRSITETDVEIIKTDLKSEPYFVSHDDVDLIYMGTMTEHIQEVVIKVLTPYKARIEELIDKGQLFLITGNAFEVFGEYIECDDGTKIDCLGIFKTHAVRKMLNRYNSLYVGKYGDVDIVGYKSQFTHSYGEFEPVFDTVRGDGLNPDTKAEGVRKNNFLGTYLIGPLLILNPLFTKELIKMLGLKGETVAYEEAAMEVFNLRLSQYMEPERGFTY